MKFRDRRDAGRQLAEVVAAQRRDDPVVVGLPRGGVAVAAEVAAGLSAPLDVLVVRKLGAPGQPELGIGAIAEGNVTVVNRDLATRLHVRSVELDALVERERVELERRVTRYRNDRSPLALTDKTVVIVDDGLATGYTAKAAIAGVRAQTPLWVVLAVPVAPADAVADLATLADEVACVESPAWFGAVGHWYEDFRQVSDEEVVDALAAAR